MTKQEPFPFVYVTDIASRRTFSVEPTRRGSHKLRISVMPAQGRELDVAIEWRKVPRHIRMAARDWLMQMDYR